MLQQFGSSWPRRVPNTADPRVPLWGKLASGLDRVVESNSDELSDLNPWREAYSRTTYGTHDRSRRMLMAQRTGDGG
jgi:hypothetical protein